VARTKVNTSLTPRWNAKVCFECPEGASATIEVLDQDIGKDSHIGAATLALSDVPKVPTALVLPLLPVAGVTTDARVLVTASYIRSYSAMKEALAAAATPGVLFDDHETKVFVPVPALGAGIHVCVDYDSKGLDVQLLGTGGSETYLDIVWTQRPMKIRRREYNPPRVPTPAVHLGVRHDLK
jgi:hypothetical protein